MLARIISNTDISKVEAVEVISFYPIILEISEAEITKLFSDYFVSSVQNWNVH